MGIASTPRGLRLHIGLFGRRNVGKSSLLNALTRQQVSIVSPIAGTTTDPVEKPMELQPLGPVVFIDTAGLDDTGALGEQRVQRTRLALQRTDVLLLVATADGWGAPEEDLLAELATTSTPVIVVLNKADLAPPPASLTDQLTARKLPWVSTVASTGVGLPALRQALIEVVPEALIEAPPLIADLVPPGELVVLVVPIDKEAPKGRLIAP